MPLVHAYTPPSLNPLEAQFLNVLLTRDWSHGFDLHGKHCSFNADPWQAHFSSACRLSLEVRGELWQIAFSSTAPLGMHPAGSQIATAPGLPEGLRLALFELSFAPALTALTDFFGLDTPPKILAEADAPLAEFACSVPLLLHLPDETIAVSVCIPSRNGAETLLLRLGQEQYKRKPIPPLLLSTALEVGSMRLTISELLALQPEDILLPATYSACEGVLCLRLASHLGIRCQIDNGRATVLGFEHRLPCPSENETRRKTMPDTLPNVAPQEEVAVSGVDTPAQNHETAPLQAALNLDTLEVVVTFELERRLMSVADITALTPGYTFPLAVQPNGPVTVRVNGKSLGTGRLVDVGGTLGVQLIQLEQEA